MKRILRILIISLLFIVPAESFPQDSLSFSGQVSTWLNYNHGNELPVHLGGRYIPQINFSHSWGIDKKIDFEASVNINGSAGFKPFDSSKFNGQIKPYRIWARYSTAQLEVRAGLQKINFGSASILRPLMWFDQVDPRDPLKLTDGVWGILGRYYFLNNANIWLWCLYGNKNPRGWEPAGTNNRFPEAGGRIQVPVPKGEAALSFNYRVADIRNLGSLVPNYAEVPENKIGFDVKVDMVIGLWVEGSWTHKGRDIGIYSNQEILNAGIDYTFGIGNGLYLIIEQLVAANDEKPFSFTNSASFSMVSLSYPVGLLDNLTAIVYYDWKNKQSYNFFNWQKQFKNLTFYLMGYWNPVQYSIPSQSSSQNFFAGKGLQIMFVLNH